MLQDLSGGDGAPPQRGFPATLANFVVGGTLTLIILFPVALIWSILGKALYLVARWGWTLIG